MQGPGVGIAHDMTAACCHAQVPSGPDLIPEAVKKPQTPQGPPPPAFPKPSTPSGPSNTFKLPSSSIQDKKPTAAPSKVRRFYTTV